MTYLKCDTISKVLNLDQSEQNIVELVIPYYFENVKIQKIQTKIKLTKYSLTHRKVEFGCQNRATPTNAGGIDPQ